MTDHPLNRNCILVPNDVQSLLEQAIHTIRERDAYLLEKNLSERCIAGRLVLYLQELFPSYHVDMEYNRDDAVPKRLGLPDECSNYQDDDGPALVVPDIIVHRRGPDGPNLLVLEIKKTTNKDFHSPCDRKRVEAFRKEYKYQYGALITCETRLGHAADIRLSQWID